MKVLVPASVNVQQLVNELKLSEPCSKNIKEKIYFFLSCVLVHNDNYKLYELPGGYRPISSVLMKKIVGNRYYYQILELLKNPGDPVIETNNSWYHPSGPNAKGYCMGYRLTAKYNTGEVIYKTLPDKFKRFLDSDQKDSELNARYKFLINQFEQNKITFNPRVYDYIRNFGNELLKRVINGNKFQTNIIYNLIGRWLDQIEKIDTKDIWVQVSPDNHRLHSNITGLRKCLRPFLLCNRKPLVEIDLTASQPYILATIMNDKFFNKTEIGYNLYTIYPNLYNKIIYNNTTYSRSNYCNKLINYNSTYSGTTNNNYFINNSSCSSFMWCKFLTLHETENVKDYTTLPFDQDFYSEVLKMYYKKGLEQEDLDHLRNDFKRSVMFTLFDDNKHHRNKNPYINIFKSVFPGVDRWITEIHEKVGNKEFAYLLQRTESHLMLNTVCKEFNKIYPQRPLFTIHDAILTHQEYIPDLTRFVLSRLEEETGVVGGIKIKSTQIDPEPRIEDLDKEWDKIKIIVSKEQYEKNSCGVFSMNIRRGFEFLTKNW